MTSSTDEAMGPIISTVPESHNDLQREIQNFKHNHKTQPCIIIFYLQTEGRRNYPFISVRPYVVFNPTTPQREEGMRTEPAFLIHFQKLKSVTKYGG